MTDAPSPATEFVPVRLSTLRGDSSINFDLFVQVAAKYVAYVHKGDTLSDERYDRLKAKNVKKLFIRPDDESAYRAHVNANIERAYSKDSKQSIAVRGEIIHGAQVATTERILDQPNDHVAYTMAKKGASRYVEFLTQQEKAVQSILQLENTNRELAHHGVAVSALSIAIAQKTGLTDVPQLEMLALGALLHDIGHTKLKSDFSRPYAELDPALKVEYMKHSSVGGELVQIHRHFDAPVIDIITQHEELVDGSGYPNKLQQKHTNPLAVIVSTANDFDRFMMYRKLALGEGIKAFTIARLGLHPLAQIQALKSLS